MVSNQVGMSNDQLPRRADSGVIRYTWLGLPVHFVEHDEYGWITVQQFIDVSHTSRVQPSSAGGHRKEREMV